MYTWVFVCAPHACSTNRSQKRAFDALELEVTDSYELPSGCWNLNPCPLKEQPTVLTFEPSLQPVPDVLYLFSSHSPLHILWPRNRQCQPELWRTRNTSKQKDIGNESLLRAAVPQGPFHLLSLDHWYELALFRVTGRTGKNLQRCSHWSQITKHADFIATNA